jgi:hypothetical protein
MMPFATKERIQLGAAALVAWIFALAAVSAQTGSLAGIPALHQGVVVDAAAGRAFVMNLESAIDGLDLATGSVRWTSRAAAKPLMIVGRDLIAQAPPGERGQLMLAVLDSGTGTARQRLEVEFPPGVRANLADSPSEVTEVQIFMAGTEPIVVWTARRQSLRGMPEFETAPTREAVTAQAIEAEPLQGAARLNLVRGNVVAMSYEDAMALKSQPLSFASVAATAGLAQMTSVDGRHVLRSERAEVDGPRARYRWTISESSGATVGTISAPVSMAPFAVGGNHLFYVALPSLRREGDKFVDEPLRLRALDLSSGAEVWARQVADTAYRGPFPP